MAGGGGGGGDDDTEETLLPQISHNEQQEAGRKNRARIKRIKDTINIYYLYNFGEMKLMDRGRAQSASDNPLAVLRLNRV